MARGVLAFDRRRPDGEAEAIPSPTKKDGRGTSKVRWVSFSEQALPCRLLGWTECSLGCDVGSARRRDDVDAGDLQRHYFDL